MNKINPIFDAMSEIDNEIVSGALEKERKHPRGFKPMMIAAAAAALCAATAVTAAATIKLPAKVTMNNEPVSVGYDEYFDDMGREIRTYVYQVPDYALLKDVPGCTAVGDVKAVCLGENFEDDWVLVDEEGTVFADGINDLKVLCEVLDGDWVGFMDFRCANFNRDEYDIENQLSDMTADHSDTTIDFSIVPLSE